MKSFNFEVGGTCTHDFSFTLLQKGYRSLHTAARKDFAKAAKLLLQKDHKPDIEAPVRYFSVYYGPVQTWCLVPGQQHQSEHSLLLVLQH